MGNGAIDLVDYVECRELIPGQAVLVITLVSEPQAFKREMQAAQPVIDTIALAGNQTLDPLAAYGQLDRRCHVTGQAWPGRSPASSSPVRACWG